MVRPLDLLIPRDPLRHRNPDPHFGPEAEAAVALGLGVHLVDHDAVVAGDPDGGLRGLEPTGSNLIYRGWMIPPVRYRSMAEVLRRRGAGLVTSPEAYVAAHHLPNWYGTLARSTAESVWTSGFDLVDLRAAAERLGPGPAILKDYSKSEKHHWDDAMFVPEVTDHRRLEAVANRFQDLRGDHLDTGFVLRRFEAWQPGEWRSWWRDGRCVAVGPHPDTPELPVPQLDLGPVAADVGALQLPFISVDLAVSSDTGELRIVEIGDGQVSDRPRTSDPTRFLAAILGAPDVSDATGTADPNGCR